MSEALSSDSMSTDCKRCDGTGSIDPPWPVGPSGAYLSSHTCSACGGTGKLPTGRPVMNPPADEAEAGNRANTAPRQADPAAPGRGETGASSGSEARPVTATEHRSSKQQCEHTKVFVTDSTMRRNQVPCPWCKDVEIERLRAELAEVTRISHLYRNEAERLGSKLSSSAVETKAEPLCDGEVRVIYEHGEPTGVRDAGGYLCFFNRVTKWPGQEDRYRKELALRARHAEVIANALRSAVEPARELSASEAESFDKTLARSPRRVETSERPLTNCRHCDNGTTVTADGFHRISVRCTEYPNEGSSEKVTQPLSDHLKAPVKAGDPCPAIDDAHTEHKGKCVYCGAPMAQAEAEEPTRHNVATVRAFGTTIDPEKSWEPTTVEILEYARRYSLSTEEARKILKAEHASGINAVKATENTK